MEARQIRPNTIRRGGQIDRLDFGMLEQVDVETVRPQTDRAGGQGRETG